VTIIIAGFPLSKG